jgi:hypothetical protein
MSTVEVKHYGKIEFGLMGQTKLTALIYDDDQYNCEQTIKFFKQRGRQNKIKLNFYLKNKDGKLKEPVIYLSDTSENINSKNAYALHLIRVEDEDNLWTIDDREARNLENTIWCAAEVNLFFMDLSDSSKRMIKCSDKKFLRYKIALDYFGYFKYLHQHIRSTLSSSYEADITSYFKSFKGIVENIDEESLQLVEYHKIKSIIDEFIIITDEIILNPKSVISKKIIMINPSSTLQLLSSVQSSSLPTLNSFDNKKRPLEIEIQTYWHNQHTNENFFVKYGISFFIGKLLEIRTQLEEYIEQINIELGDVQNFYDIKESKTKIEKHRIIVANIFLYEKILRDKYQQFLPGTKLHQFSMLRNRYSETINYDKRYARFNYLISLLKALSGYLDSSEKGMPFEVLPFNKVYELWCFVIIFDNMKKIGFTCGNEHERLKFYNNPVTNFGYEFKHEDYPNLLLKMYYKRSYPKEGNGAKLKINYGLPKDRRMSSYNHILDVRKKRGSKDSKPKYSPDISIEIFDSEKEKELIPKIITFDPTLSLSEDKIRLKYDYLHSIRYFTENDDTYPTDAKRIVSSAWAIYPGNNSNYNNPPFYQEEISGDYSTGSIVLNHKEVGSGDSMVVLKKILNHTELFNIA